MQDNFLELDTTLNDEPVCGEINEYVYLHTFGVSNKNTLCTFWIKCLPILKGNHGPCTRTEYMKVGHFRFEAAPSLEGGFILEKYTGRFVLYVGCIIKFFSPLSLWK
jgi:hypothetical protein